MIDLVTESDIMDNEHHNEKTVSDPKPDNGDSRADMLAVLALVLIATATAVFWVSGL